MESVSKRVSMAYTRFDPQPVLYLWMDGKLIPSKSSRRIAVENLYLFVHTGTFLRLASRAVA